METQPEFSFEEMVWAINDTLANNGIELSDIANGSGGQSFWNQATRDLNEHLHDGKIDPDLGFVTVGNLKRAVKENWDPLCVRLQEIFDGDAEFKNT